MNTDQNRPSSPATDSAASDSAVRASATRRRMLLKGLAKGSAVLAAAAPIKTLATTSVTHGGQLCSVSGSLSGVRSQTAGLPICGGKPISHYCGSNSTNNWPINNGIRKCKKNTTTWHPSADACHLLLAGCGVNASLWNRMESCRTGSDNSEAHWICALLNASQVAGFPYTHSEIIAMYNAGGVTRLNGLNFFKTYMEQA